jgi:hypothetical protein
MDLNSLKDTPPWEWPKGAHEILAVSLGNRELAESERIVAADLAGDLVVMDDAMAELLLSIVRSAGEPELLRARAAISLGPALEEADIEGFDDALAKPPIGKKAFLRIQEVLRRVYSDESAPVEVRRRALEASVRAPRAWHKEAVRAAYSSDRTDWKLTAVFGMGWVAGFDNQIVEMLESRNPDFHFEAVRAAGGRAVEAAWPHIAKLLASAATEKRLLLAAIETASAICPPKARAALSELARSDDEEIADAASEALHMADLRFEEDNAGDNEEDDDEEDDDEDEDSAS